MTLKSRKCAALLAITAVLGVYGTAAYRVELLRQQPYAASSCSSAHCLPHAGTLSVVR
ncbi:hypothetical protein [Pseudomonas qingdaonensis]|uniref:hypothetical protein n=1 Tax=Pseudomonas qingdaonensis TaxID=2056231 RepID=UPI00333FB7BD